MDAFRKILLVFCVQYGNNFQINTFLVFLPLRIILVIIISEILLLNFLKLLLKFKFFYQFSANFKKCDIYFYYLDNLPSFKKKKNESWVTHVTLGSLIGRFPKILTTTSFGRWWSMGVSFISNIF